MKSSQNPATCCRCSHRWVGAGKPWLPIGCKSTRILADMLFMVIEDFHQGDPKPVHDRFVACGRMLPEGVTYQASWIDPHRAATSSWKQRVRTLLHRGSRRGTTSSILRSCRSSRRLTIGQWRLIDRQYAETTDRPRRQLLRQPDLTRIAHFTPRVPAYQVLIGFRTSARRGDFAPFRQ